MKCEYVYKKTVNDFSIYIQKALKWDKNNVKCFASFLLIKQFNNYFQSFN